FRPPRNQLGDLRLRPGKPTVRHQLRRQVQRPGPRRGEPEDLRPARVLLAVSAADTIATPARGRSWCASGVRGAPRRLETVRVELAKPAYRVPYTSRNGWGRLREGFGPGGWGFESLRARQRSCFGDLFKRIVLPSWHPLADGRPRLPANR